MDFFHFKAFIMYKVFLANYKKLGQEIAILSSSLKTEITICF